jgi:hypothetical protein
LAADLHLKSVEFDPSVLVDLIADMGAEHNGR